MVGVGAIVFAIAGRTLWQQLGSQTALLVFVALALLVTIDAAIVWWAIRRPVIHADAPSEAYLGEDVDVRLRVSGLRRQCVVSIVSLPPQADATLGWAGGAGHREVLLRARPPIRGRITRLIVEVTVTGPLGFTTGVRRLAVPLPAPLVSAPRARLGDHQPSLAAPSEGDGDRGVRPYQPGDPRRRVHWPATAATGSLVVRTAEMNPTNAEVVVVLSLRGSEESCDDAAGRCRGLVERLRLAGYPVRLVTAERADRSPVGFDAVVLSPRRRPVQVVAPPPAEIRMVDAMITSGSVVHQRIADAVAGGPDLVELPSGTKAWCVRADGVDGWMK